MAICSCIYTYTHCTLFSEIERNIADAEQQITQYRDELLESREIRRNRQEYDALAQVRIGGGGEA